MQQTVFPPMIGQTHLFRPTLLPPSVSQTQDLPFFDSSRKGGWILSL